MLQRLLRCNLEALLSFKIMEKSSYIASRPFRKIWSLIADSVGFLMRFLVKGVSPKCSEERTKRCRSQFVHNKMYCSNYTKNCKQNVSKDVWEYYL